jgi:transposase InsO family protein
LPRCAPKGKLYLFVATGRTSKFAYAELHERHERHELHERQTRQTRRIAADFLRSLIEVVPYQLHTVLTDNGIQFTHRKTDRWAFEHLFDRVCREHGIVHRLTRPNHPWTNGEP